MTKLPTNSTRHFPPVYGCQKLVPCGKPLNLRIGALLQRKKQTQLGLIDEYIAKKGRSSLCMLLGDGSS